MFQKLKDLSQFTVKSYVKKVWSKWDEANKKFIKSDVWMTGLSPKYEVETEGGQLELSQDQMGQMLVATLSGGQANIVGRTFTVKTNGKEKLEIRYYLNLLNPNAALNVQGEAKPIVQNTDDSKIPF